MTRASQMPGASLRPLYLTAAFLSLVAAGYALAGVRESPAVALGTSLGLLVTGAVWVRGDARVHGVRLPYDWGFFAVMLWPLFLPWYAVRTRGRGAPGLIARVVGAFILPALASAVASLVRGAPPG